MPKPSPGRRQPVRTTVQPGEHIIPVSKIPATATYTGRQLGTITRILEALTEERRAAEAAGTPTRPDAFPVRFPSKHLGVVLWQQAEQAKHPSPPYRYVLALDATAAALAYLPGRIDIIRVRNGRIVTAGGTPDREALTKVFADMAKSIRQNPGTEGRSA